MSQKPHDEQVVPYYIIAKHCFPQLKRVKASAVIHYHRVIHKALKYAVKIDLLDSNPADKVERPKAEKFVGSFYDSDEAEKLFKPAKGRFWKSQSFRKHFTDFAKARG